MKKFIITTAFACIGIAFAGNTLLNQNDCLNASNNNSHKFDFYLLATQWIPGWCVVGTGKSGVALDNGRACQQQASNPLMYHGLWPENNDGSYPLSCSTVGQLDTTQLTFANPFNDYLSNPQAFLDHEWAKHGTCSNYFTSGMESSDQSEYYRQVNHYFSSSIYLYQQIKLPTFALQISVANLRKQIHSLNPQILDDSIVVSCTKDLAKQQYFTGLWFCINKNLNKYTSCPANLLKAACKGVVLTR